MYTIKNNINNEIIIKNSRFITYLIKINNTNILEEINKLKEIYPKATHYCYAYIYNDIKKCSDDHEPARTAGMPMLNVLEKEQLNNLLAVTIRYFGGIKLGAGGLVRAYTKSVTEALKNALLVELEKGYKVSITFDYSKEKDVNYLLNDSDIISKTYDNQINYIVLVKKNVLEKLSFYNYEILEEVLIEK